MPTKIDLISLICEGDLITFPSALANYLKEQDIDSLGLNYSFLINKVIKHIPHVRHSFFLTIAVQRGHINTCKLLLEHGATLDATSNGSVNILVAAVDSGSLEMVRFIFEKGAQLNETICLLTTPLMHATELGHIDIVNLLLVEHYNKNCEIKDTALLAEAALAHLPTHKQKSLDLIELFIEHGITHIPSEYMLPTANTINILPELLEIFEKTGRYLNSVLFHPATQAQITAHHRRIDTKKQATTTQLVENTKLASILCPIITDYLFEPNLYTAVTPSLQLYLSHTNSEPTPPLESTLLKFKG